MTRDCCCPEERIFFRPRPRGLCYPDRWWDARQAEELVALLTGKPTPPDENVILGDIGA